MCIIETKTYHHPDGRREIIESTRRCREYRQLGRCSNQEYRTVESASLVEHRPSSDRADPHAVLTTQGRGGRETVYQDVSRRQSVRRSSIRRSNNIEQRPPMESHSSGSLASYPETRPPAPSPPPLRSSLRRPTMDDTAARTVAPDGTAIYSRAPSRELPRATDNERRTCIVEPARTRRGSISSTTAELGEDDTPRPPPRQTRQRRPSVTIDTSPRQSSSASATTSSPGLSSLPRPTVSGLRHDSARDLPGQYRPRASTNSRQRQQSDDERQAQILRERLAETERRQQARQNSANAAREASVERHRREAAAALEGDRVRRQERSREAERQAKLEAELRQTDLERDASEARRRESDQAARYHDPRTSGRSSRRLTGTSYAPSTSSPLSTRSPVYPPQPVSIHQPDPPGRRYSSLRDRGDAVIAREQMRTERATRRLSAALGDMTVEDPYDQDVEYELDDYYVTETLHRHGSRRAQREADRAERRREFWQ